MIRTFTLVFVCLLLNNMIWAQEGSRLKMIFELSSFDNENISANEIVKQCSAVLTKKEKPPLAILAEATYRRGDAFYRLGKYNDAFADFDEVCRLTPQEAKPRSMRALTLAATNRLDDALADAKEAIRLGPKLAPAHATLGYLLFLQGQLDDAWKSAKIALELDKHYHSAYYLCALVAHARGKREESLSLVNQYLERRPLPELTEPEHPYHFRGWLLLGFNRPSDALNNFLLARKLNPVSLNAAVGIHASYRELGKWHLTLSAAEAVVKLHPNVPEYHVNHAYALAKTKSYDAARKSLDEAIRIASPNNANLTANIGNVFFQLGENEKAAEHLKRALEIDQECGPAIWGKALLLATCSDPRYRDGAQALKIARSIYDREKKRFGEHHATNLLLADAEAEAGHYEDALRLARKALDLVLKQASPSRFCGRPVVLTFYFTGISDTMTGGKLVLARYLTRNFK